MSDPLVAEAVDIMARSILALLVKSPDLTLGWEDFPEIGEHDWDAIEARMLQLAPEPKNEVYQAAFDFLAGRARNVPA